MKTLLLSIIVMIGIMIVMSSFNSTFAQSAINSSNSILPIPSSILHSPIPTLLPSENQSVVNVALSVPELQNWSHDWKYLDMGFGSNNKAASDDFEWQYASVVLKAPSNSAPFPCNNDWRANIVIDMTTMKVVQATYPTMESHSCQVITLEGSANEGIKQSINVTNIESPLKQFKMGTFAQDVRCHTGLQLFFKAEDYTPACAQSETAIVLIQRGWAIAHLPEPFIAKFAITGLQQNYTAGQPINATVTYSGYYWYTEPDVKILNANGTKIWFNCAYCYARSEPVPFPALDAFTYIVRDYSSNKLPVINKTSTYTMIASLHNKTASIEFTIVKPLVPLASFEPCDTPFQQSNRGIAVLYIPANSIGKICVRYSNPNEPKNASLAIFDALSYQTTKSITSWAEPSMIPSGNSTVRYSIKTGNHTGLYGLTIFCSGMPLAVGYDDKSNFTLNDFPWEKSQTINCPMMTYQYKIDSLSGIGVKYIPYP